MTLLCPEDFSTMENIYLASNAMTRQNSGSENNMLFRLSGFVFVCFSMVTDYRIRIDNFVNLEYIRHIIRACHFIDLHRSKNPNENGIYTLTFASYVRL